MEPFTQRVISIIQSIPHGHVMTYGQVARMAGNPHAARQVVRILHSSSEKYHLPWHRVINSKGEIGNRDSYMMTMQKKLLVAEGVPFIGPMTINLAACLFLPFS